MFKGILNTELFHNCLSSFDNNLGGWGAADHPLSLTCGLGRPVSAQFRVSYQNITPSILNFTSGIKSFWVAIVVNLVYTYLTRGIRDSLPALLGQNRS